MKFFRLSTNKHFYKLLLRYAVFLLVPLSIIAAITYVQCIYMIREKNIKYYDNLILKSRYSVESKLDYINDLSTLLLYNTKFQKILYEDDKMDVDEIRSDLNYYYASSELRQTSIINEYIKGAAFYIKRNNCVVHNYGVDPASTFLESTFEGSRNSFEATLEKFSRWDNLYYLPPSFVTLNYKKENTSTFIKTASEDRFSSDGSVMLFINNNAFEELLPSKNVYGSTYAFILDNTNRIIYGNLANISFITDYSFYDKNIKQASIDNIKYDVIHTKIKDVPWKLVMYIPTSSFRFTNNYSKIFLTNLIILIIAGLIIVYLISFLYYKPVNKIVTSIDSSFSSDASLKPENRDEYLFIKNSLLKLNETISQMQNDLSSYKDEISECLLTRLTMGDTFGDDFTSEFQEFCEPITEDSRYVVVSIDIDGTKLGEPELHPADDCINTFYNMISRECWYSDLQLYSPLNFCRNNTLIFGWKPQICKSVPDQRIYENLKYMLCEVKERLEKEKGIRITLGIGTIEFSPKDISKSYMNSYAALCHKIIKGAGEVIEYKHIKTESTRYFYYPVELEIELLQSFKKGNLEAAKTIISSIAEENLTNRRLNLFTTKCLYFELYTTLVKVLNMLDIQNPPVHIDSASGIYSIRDIIDLFLLLVEKLSDKKMYADNDNRNTAIQKFVDENYFNPELSQTYVASQLGVSPYFINKLFAGDFGISFQDYVNNKRISHAVKLLKQSDYAVKDIGALCGYSNKNTFIRVFKSFEGMPPGQFRKINKS